MSERFKELVLKTSDSFTRAVSSNLTPSANFTTKRIKILTVEKYSSWWRGAPAKGVGRETVARVQISPSPPSKGYKKDVAPETPDFIGGFAVSTAEKTTNDFVDVKKVFFPFCSELNSRTTEYKPLSAWIKQVHALFLFPQKGGKWCESEPT